MTPFILSPSNNIKGEKNFFFWENWIIYLSLYLILETFSQQKKQREKNEQQIDKFPFFLEFNFARLFITNLRDYTTYFLFLNSFMMLKHWYGLNLHENFFRFVVCRYKKFEDFVEWDLLAWKWQIFTLWV